MRGLRTAALLGAGIAVVSLASARPRRRPARGSRGAARWADDAADALGEATVWPPPRAARHRGRTGR